MSLVNLVVVGLLCAAGSDGHRPTGVPFPYSGLKLNGPMTSGGDIAATVDGKPRAQCVDRRFVVYMADQDSDEVVELYSVALRDASVRKLNGPLVAEGDVREFQVSADGTRVVYRADQDLDEQLELYSVPVGGGTVVRLNGPMVAGGDVPRADGWMITSDSQRVVYRADELTDEAFVLFSVSMDGGTRDELSPSGVAQDGFQVSADGSRVVYQLGSTEVWSVHLDGASPVLLTPAPPSDIDVVIVTPDSTRVVYRTRDLELPSFQAGAVYSVPIDGGTAVQLYDGLVDEDADKLRIAPDSSRLVFQSANHIYTVPPGGGPVTLIVNPFWQLWGAPRISPDSRYVVFVDGPSPGNRWACSTSIATPTRKQLNMISSLEEVAISTDSRYVVCTYSLDWLLSATRINTEYPDYPAFGPPGDVMDFGFAWGGRKVVFVAIDAAGVQNLWTNSPDGESLQLVHPPLVAGGDVTGFVSQGPLVLYRADQDSDNVFELYALHMPLVHYPAVAWTSGFPGIP